MRLKPEIKGALITLFAVALVLVCFSVVIWLRTPYEEYLADALHWHHIGPGDDVDEVIKDRRPNMIRKFDRWVLLNWIPNRHTPGTISFIGISIIAKDGKVVSAYCYDDDGSLVETFFDTLTTNEIAAYRAAFEAKVHDEFRNLGQADSTNETVKMVR
jgi:hypothetical protein